MLFLILKKLLEVFNMNIEQRLVELNIELPLISSKRINPIELGVCVDKIVLLSGKTPMVEGQLKYRGLVGSTITIEQAEKAAEICILNLLASLKEVVGDLNRVKRVLKVNGYVASESDFTDQAKIMNAASNLLNKIFGENNRHARVAIGVASLPGGAPVEIEMNVELDS